jgi:hypothetical protein
MPSDDLNEKKELAFYTVSVTAWYNTSLEHSKSLLTLSAGGIGLLITLIKMQATLSSGMLVMYIIALLAFLVCLASILYIFRQNKAYIKKVIHSNSNQERDAVLAILDDIAIWSFIIAAFFSVFIGIFPVINSYLDKVNQMSNEQNRQTSSNSTYIRESFNGASALRPQPAPANPTTTQSSNTSNGTPQPTAPNQQK